MTKAIIFDLQLFNDDPAPEPEVDVDPEVDPDTDPEVDPEVDVDPDVEPVNYGDLEIKHMDDDPKRISDFEPNEVQSLIQMGIDYERKVPKLEERAQLAEELETRVKAYEENPAYSYIDDYMKDSGYDDPFDFVRDIQISAKKKELMSDGVNETRAEELAREYVETKMQRPSTDKQTAAIKNFADWHQGKYGEPIKKDDIPDEVISAYENGEDMRTAFLEYKIGKVEMETEQRVLKDLEKKRKQSAPPVESGARADAKLTADQVASKIKGMSARQGKAWIEDNWEAIEKSGYFD